jgi:hypothetical protein
MVCREGGKAGLDVVRAWREEVSWMLGKPESILYANSIHIIKLYLSIYICLLIFDINIW